MAVILAAKRSAVVPRGGAFTLLSLQELAAPVIAALLAAAGVAAGRVDELICANALGAGGNPARICALAAGLPERVAGLSIDRQCAGGLDAVVLARALVDSGAAEVVVAGGGESYSQRPLRLRVGETVAYDQAWFTPWPERETGMAEAADRLGQRLGITREFQDLWAMESHRKALAAGPTGEIVAIGGVERDGFARVMTPELMRRAKGLAGDVTVANAAVAADAAGFVLVVSEAVARGRGLKIMSGVTLGGDPFEPGVAPVAAIAAVLAKSGIAVNELAVVELMEAYAVQAIACADLAGLDPSRINPGGGALARGHPIGASGAILAVRLFYELKQGFGLAAIAAAGGIGTALLVAR